MKTRTFAEDLSERLTSNSVFWDRLDALHCAGAKTSLNAIFIDSNLHISEQEIASLLYCASVFVQTSDERNLSMAQAIALNALLVSADSAIRQRCIHILTELGNFPSLSYIDKNFNVENPSLLARLNRRVSQELNSVAIGSDRIALTDFQKEVWDTLPNASTLAISAPTSAGKSFLVIEHLCRLASTLPSFFAVYIAPTRALLAEVYNKIKDRLASIEDVRVSSVPTLDLNGSSRQIFILTQERLQALLSISNLKFDLVIIDEAQNFADGPRGILLEECLDQVYQRNQLTKIFLLAPGAEGFDEVASSIGMPKIKPAVSKVSPVIQNRILVSKVAGRNHFHLDLLLRSKRLSLGDALTKRGIDLPETFLASVALELGSEGGSLVYATGPENAEKTTTLLAQGLDERLDARLDALADFIRKHIHPEYILAKHVKKGLAFHYGKMPSLLREALENAFKDNDINFLVCTTTLFQGINLPAKNVFIDTPTRGRGEGTILDSAQLWNFAGRAGRMLGDIVGNVFLVDYDNWPEQPMDDFVGFKIRSALKATLVSSMDEVIEAVKGNLPKKQLNEDTSKIRASAGLLIAKAATGQIEGLTSRLLGSHNDKTRILVEAAQESAISLALPPKILTDNWMINPFGQRRLYDRIVEKIRNEDFETLIPINPHEKLAPKVYAAIFNRIQRTITGNGGNFGALVSTIAMQWMKGEPYPLIIARAILKKKRAYEKALEEYNLQKELEPKSKSRPPKSVNPNSVIRQTFDLIEDQVRFQYVQYGKCYVDLLRLALETEGREDLVEQIFDFSLALELGISTGSGRAFIELGLSRISATVLEKIYPNTNLTVNEAGIWLRNLDVEALQLSAVIVEELKRLNLLNPMSV